MNATISLNSVTLADVPFNGLGHVAVSGGRKPIAHQRARFTVDADQRGCTAGLIEQVPDLAKIADALLAQQRVHVRGGQAGPGKLEAYRFRRQLYYATCAILVSIPSSYSEGVRYPSPF